MGISAIIGSIIDAVATAGAIEAPAAFAGEALAGGAAAADVGAAVALPAIDVVAGAAPELATGAEIAALGAPTAALTVNAAAPAAEAAGAFTGSELAGVAGAGVAADAAFGGAAGPMTGGMPTSADLTGGPSPGVPSAPAAAPPTPSGAGLPTSGGVSSPTEALSGSTGPTSALSPEGPSSFNSLWANTEADINAGGPIPTGQLGLDTVPVNPVQTQSFASTTEPGSVFTGDTGGGQALPLQAQSGNIPAGQLSQLPPEITSGASTPGQAAIAEPGAAPAANLPSSPANATAGGATGGIEGTLNSILSSPATRALSLAAPVGALGLTLARGQPSLPPAEQRALSQLGPVESFASSSLSRAQSGTITPAQAEQITTYRQNARNQLYQFYASQGRDPNMDTDYLQGIAQIDANAVAMKQQFIDSMITNGLNASGVVNSELNAAANLQVQQDQAFQQSISAALQSFGLVAAISTVGQRPAQVAAAAPPAGQGAG